jgi:hypothetical protein
MVSYICIPRRQEWKDGIRNMHVNLRHSIVTCIMKRGEEVFGAEHVIPQEFIRLNG